MEEYFHSGNVEDARNKDDLDVSDENGEDVTGLEHVLNSFVAVKRAEQNFMHIFGG